ncbi:MAG: phosphate propanoyltransferase [Clostridia bacterium]|nr:phosphate propanoyltransferase [Clostridia bacterium]
MTEKEIQHIVSKVLNSLEPGKGFPHTSSEDNKIKVEVSARHAHLTKEAVEILFGKGAKLEKERDLSQPGEYLSKQRLKLITPKGEISNVAILGPEREAVQVELSMTDAKALAIKAPVNLSGNLQGAGDVYMLAEKGLLFAPCSVIIARAHMHMTPVDAQKHALKDGQVVRVKIDTDRPVTLDQVLVRVKENFSTAIHIDFDEANACGLQKDSVGTIVK